MASVSVPGPGGTTITQTFSNSFNSALAKSIADALANAANKGDLFIQTVTGSVSAPVNDSGKIGELVVIPGSIGDVTVPSGSNYSFVVDNSAGPDTIHGSTPGLSIMGGGGTHTIIAPALITLGDTSSGSSNAVTITGAGDNVAVGNGTNTLTGTGSGTMSGGFGNDTFIEVGGASYLINSQGFGDTIRAADGGTTVNSSGPGAMIVAAGSGALTASVSGGATTVPGTSGSQVFGGKSDCVACQASFRFLMIRHASRRLKAGALRHRLRRLRP